MKSFIAVAALLSTFATTCISFAQPVVTANIAMPGSGVTVADNLFVAVQTSSTYELQGVQAEVGGHVVNLVYAASAYTNCSFCSPVPGWTNVLSLVGLPHGTNTLTVTATDVFGNTNQVQRKFVHDTPPVIAVTSPTNGTVARPYLSVSYSGIDDDTVVGTQLTLAKAVDYLGGPVLATATNTLNTNVFLGDYDGQAISLGFFARDSANQLKAVFRQVYVQSSTNLVEVARVSEGRIIDVQPDRILFLLEETDGTGPTLKVQSRTNGAETVVYHQPGTVWRAMLSPQGAVASVNSVNPGYVYQWRNGVQIQDAHVVGGAIALGVKGNYAAWSWGIYSGFPQLGLINLQTGTNLVITNMHDTSDISFDVADNGDIAFAGRIDAWSSPSIYRYHQGSITQLVNDPASTNYYPKTDGTNVFYIKTTPTNQALMQITGAGESIVTTGTSIGSDYLLNNGWLAYARSGGGQTQIWRRSPAGTLTQLTFFGTSSALAALAPNGEVAFSNGGRLYISKGTWPAVDIAAGSPASGLNPFWQDNRWYASMGRSLFQVFTGTPEITSPKAASGMFSVDLIAAHGQRVVTQISSNCVDWVDICTNVVADGANLKVESPVGASSSGQFYRLRLQ